MHLIDFFNSRAGCQFSIQTKDDMQEIMSHNGTSIRERITEISAKLLFSLNIVSQQTKDKWLGHGVIRIKKSDCPWVSDYISALAVENYGIRYALAVQLNKLFKSGIETDMYSSIFKTITSEKENQRPAIVQSINALFEHKKSRSFLIKLFKKAPNNNRDNLTYIAYLLKNISAQHIKNLIDDQRVDDYVEQLFHDFGDPAYYTNLVRVLSLSKQKLVFLIEKTAPLLKGVNKNSVSILDTAKNYPEDEIERFVTVYQPFAEGITDGAGIGMSLEYIFTVPKEKRRDFIQLYAPLIDKYKHEQPEQFQGVCFMNMIDQSFPEKEKAQNTIANTAETLGANVRGVKTPATSKNGT